MDVCLELWLALCFSFIALSSLSDSEAPKAENVRWVSVDFKTVLRWSSPPTDYTYTVSIAEDHGDWLTAENCIQITDTECDLTQELRDLDREFLADVQTEFEYMDLEELPHTHSAPFNPYKHSELSAVSFSVHKVSERSVTLNISDPLTGLHVGNKQLSIRDVLKKDLKYKVSYYKAGSTGKRDQILDSNLAQIPNLDPGVSYCFMVAAFVPSRAKSFQQGDWSTQTCTSGSGILDEVDLRTVFLAVFIPLVLVIVVVTVLVICCRFCRRKQKKTDSPAAAQTQSSVV